MHKIFNEPIREDQELVSLSKNRLQRLSLLFVSVTRFSDFSCKTKYHDKIKTKSSTNLGNIFKMNTFFDSIGKSHV